MKTAGIGTQNALIDHALCELLRHERQKKCNRSLKISGMWVTAAVRFIWWTPKAMPGDAGMDFEMIKGIVVNGRGFEDIRHCILTHCHIDHTAVCARLSRDLPEIRFYAHALDAAPIEEPGHDGRTAAGWYGITYEPVSLYETFDADTVFTLGGVDFHCLHIPGHTPGSIAVMVESAGKKVLSSRPASASKVSRMPNPCEWPSSSQI